MKITEAKLRKMIRGIIREVTMLREHPVSVPARPATPAPPKTKPTKPTKPSPTKKPVTIKKTKVQKKQDDVDDKKATKVKIKGEEPKTTGGVAKKFQRASRKGGYEYTDTPKAGFTSNVKYDQWTRDFDKATAQEKSALADIDTAKKEDDLLKKSKAKVRKQQTGGGPAGGRAAGGKKGRGKKKGKDDDE